MIICRFYLRNDIEMSPIIRDKIKLMAYLIYSELIDYENEMNKNVANIIEILGLRNVIIYIIAINIITFFAMFIDKKKAQHGRH